jgi:hypothetical protein
MSKIISPSGDLKVTPERQITDRASLQVQGLGRVNGTNTVYNIPTPYGKMPLRLEM